MKTFPNLENVAPIATTAIGEGSLYCSRSCISKLANCAALIIISCQLLCDS